MEIKSLKSKFIIIPKYVWILPVIMSVGIFLRTYNFHDWLQFTVDQSRDATLVQEIAQNNSGWPLLGPTMRKSSDSRDQLFHLGAMYYYFQIISVKIFGSDPSSMAYPDLIFSLLSIPLFYLFLRRYFSENISLGLFFLYAINIFLIQYSRFAWNPNSIPFFAILLLSSLHEFLVKSEKTNWLWIVLIGMALGVGVQLHAIILVLFLVIVIITSVFLLIKNWKVWSRIVVIIIVAGTLNIGQIISEYKNDYANTKVFFHSIGSDSGDKKAQLPLKIVNNLNCNIQANAYILSIIGSDKCDFSVIDSLQHNAKERIIAKVSNPLFILGVASALLFSVFGYGLVVRMLRVEKVQSKKYFLGLISLYAATSFIIMVPVISDNLTEFRYFIHTFFIPFTFLGLVASFLSEKFDKKYVVVISMSVVLFFVISNVVAINSKVTILQDGKMSDGHFVILGEIEPMTKYLMENSDNQKNIYLAGNRIYMANFLHPLTYIIKNQGYVIVRVTDINDAELAKTPLFYITKNSNKNLDGNIGSYEILDFKIFGNVIIYKLKN